MSELQEEILKQMKAIERGVKQLRSGPLNDRALLLLLQDSIGCAKQRRGYGNSKGKFTIADLQAVLDGMESMVERFTEQEQGGE